MIPYKKLKARIEKDKARKSKRQEAIHQKYDLLENVFTPRHYVKSIKKCRKGVAFKLSVQRYSARPFKHMTADCKSMLAGKAPLVSSSKKEVIRERGKTRIITPIKMRDRVNQRVLCDYALTPLISRRLIYDNGASMKDKGVQFARDRFNLMLEKAKRLWGNNFYALTFDFEHFFDSIPHWLCKQELDKTFRDKRIADIAMQVIEGYQTRDALEAGDTEKIELLSQHKGIGVCLGSHVSQLMALCVPNFLDHFIKDVKGVKFYIRYMDDGIILHNDRVYLRQLLGEMREMCIRYDMRLHQHKTLIVPMRKGIAFLKTRYKIHGLRTVKRLDKATAVRMRRRLKKFVGLVAKGKMNMKMVWDSVQSWLGHTHHAMAYRQRVRMMQLYKECFGQEWGCANA